MASGTGRWIAPEARVQRYASTFCETALEPGGWAPTHLGTTMKQRCSYAASFSCQILIRFSTRDSRAENSIRFVRTTLDEMIAVGMVRDTAHQSKAF
jgi:hypothetical protein